MQERIDITSLSNEGYGIGILKSGKKCFVEGALPGESVAVTVTKEASRYSFGKAYEFYETSPDATATICSIRSKATLSGRPLQTASR